MVGAINCGAELKKKIMHLNLLLFSIQDGSILCQHTGANAVITCQVDFPRLCRKRQSVHSTLPPLCLSLAIRFTWGTGEVGCNSQKHTPLDSAALCTLWSVNMIKSWCGPQEAGSDAKPHQTFRPLAEIKPYRVKNIQRQPVHRIPFLSLLLKQDDTLLQQFHHWDVWLFAFS